MYITKLVYCGDCRGTLHGCRECTLYFVQHSILRYSSIFRDLDIDVLFPKMHEISLSWK